MLARVRQRAWQVLGSVVPYHLKGSFQRAAVVRLGSSHEFISTCRRPADRSRATYHCNKTPLQPRAEVNPPIQSAHCYGVPSLDARLHTLLHAEHGSAQRSCTQYALLPESTSQGRPQGPHNNVPASLVVKPQIPSNKPCTYPPVSSSSLPSPSASSPAPSSASSSLS